MKRFTKEQMHIFISQHDQITEEIGTGKVSASNMYATVRFNAWVSPCSWSSGQEMAGTKQETLEYFVTEYRKMLKENLEDYIENFESYLEPES